MQNKYFFQNSKGDKLCGLLTTPDQPTDVIAVLCHGHSSSKNSNGWVVLEPILVENKIAVFRFDFYGNGESEGKFEDGNVSENVDDTLKAIAFVKDKGYKRIILVGSSFGGLTSNITASKTNDLAALVLKCPVSDYREVQIQRYGPSGLKEWKEKGYATADYLNHGVDRNLTLNYSFVEDYEKYDAYTEAEKIKVPTLIVHGTADESVPFSQSQKLAAHIPLATLVPIEGSDHRYTDPQKFKEMTKVISDFIIAQANK